MAAEIVSLGRVRLNHVKLEKPSHLVKPGDVLTLTLQETIRVIRVLGSADRRGTAPEAYQLYEDVNPPQNTSFASEKTSA
jgi:ribosome-associated heat shock protein Hsp15